MPKFKVNLVKELSFSMTVEAENEDAAYDEALDYAPGISAQESGWGQKWSVDDGDWQSPEDYYGEARCRDIGIKGVQRLNADGSDANDEEDDD